MAVADGRPVRGWQRLFVAAATGVCLGAAAPPEGPSLLCWIAFAPVLWIVRGAGLSWRARAVYGFVSGLGIGLLGFPWIAELLVRFGEFSTWAGVACLVAFSVFTALPLAAWTVVVTVGPDRLGHSGAWRVAWPCLTWIAIVPLWPAIFPYTPIIGLASAPEFIQAAELGGVELVEGLVVLCGALLVEAVEPARTRRSRLGYVACAVGVCAGAYGLGLLRMRSLEATLAEAPVVRVGVVQPNTPLRYFDRGAKMERLWSASAAVEAEGAEIVVWPEAGVYPYLVTRPYLKDAEQPSRQVMRRHRIPTVFGAASRELGARYDYNSVFWMDPTGRVRGTFDKVNLMPFGEYVPIVDPKWAQSKIPAMSHNLAGDGPRVFEVELEGRASRAAPRTVRLGPLVCYEDIFPGFARDVAAQDGGVEVFVNLTIDTWFGDTAASWEHQALAVFRAVEHRIPLVRSVSAGVSGVIDATGRVVTYLPVRAVSTERLIDPEHLVYDVPIARNTADHPTWYARGGWAFPWACRLGLVAWGIVAFVGWSVARRRR